MTDDIFRPHHQPARMIYDAFQEEAAKRGDREFEDWNESEVQAVWRAARDAAQQRGLRIPLIDEVRLAERCARGHIDYGATWTHQVVRLLHEKEPSTT